MNRPRYIYANWVYNPNGQYLNTFIKILTTHYVIQVTCMNRELQQMNNEAFIYLSILNKHKLLNVWMDSNIKNYKQFINAIKTLYPYLIGAICIKWFSKDKRILGGGKYAF